MGSKNYKSPKGKSRKVAKFCIGADEVIVANIPKRVPPKGGTSEGLHIV